MITKEQEEELWKGLGLTHEYHGASSTLESGWYSEGKFVGDNTPPIDLNNLFKWAVPKLIKTNTYFMLMYSRSNKKWYCQIGLNSALSEDPAQALALAIKEKEMVRKTS